jgi:hypothetical protein
MSLQLNFFVSAAAAILLAACDGSVRRVGPPEVGLEVVRVDLAHNRRWVLREHALTVYDNLNGRRLRHIILPDWVVAGPRHGCAPDMVLDASGAALVSSNVLPVLWRVDPRRFQITRIALELESDTDKDVGFAGLSFSADGVLIAAGATFPSLWRIDLQAARATKLPSLPTPDVCDSPRLLRTAERN